MDLKSHQTNPQHPPRKYASYYSHWFICASVDGSVIWLHPGLERQNLELKISLWFCANATVGQFLVMMKQQP